MNSLRNKVDSNSLQKRKYTNLLFKNISPQVHRLSNIFISEFLWNVHFSISFLTNIINQINMEVLIVLFDSVKK